MRIQTCPSDVKRGGASECDTFDAGDFSTDSEDHVAPWCHISFRALKPFQEERKESILTNIYIYSIYIYVKDLQKQEYSEYGRYENKL